MFDRSAALPVHGQEPPAAGLSPFAGDFGNALWTTAIFLIVVLVLGPRELAAHHVRFGVIVRVLNETDWNLLTPYDRH